MVYTKNPSTLIGNTEMPRINLTIQGILFLLSLGAYFMPIKQSWAISIIIFSVAFIWLVATVIYWQRHKKKSAKGVIAKGRGSLPTKNNSKLSRLIAPFIWIVIGLGLFIWGMVGSNLSFRAIPISFGMAFLIWGISVLQGWVGGIEK
jgi:hypothetical protein